MFIKEKLFKTDSKKGYLVLIGGAEDKRNNKLILKRTVEINNAKSVSVIPTASNYPAGLAEDYQYAFRDLGAENVYNIDIRERSDADKTDFLENIKMSDLIFFTGGDQARLVNTLKGTKILDLIFDKFLKGCTIAGTSAGAAAAGDPIFYDGDYEGLKKGSIRISDGFGFIKNVTIDTHFVNRGRLGRLTQFLCTGKSTRGIGLGEDTAIIIYPTDYFEVIGSEMVTVLSTDAVSYNNYDEISEGDPIIIDGLNVGFLQQGSIFNLKEWKIETGYFEHSLSRNIESYN
jgi:cyanophycinase